MARQIGSRMAAKSPLTLSLSLHGERDPYDTRRGEFVRSFSPSEPACGFADKSSKLAKASLLGEGQDEGDEALPPNWC
jgi:hypothetical protein